MKPIAFRIWDFKSIVDSGECILSADHITVLAGQNESGKTALLQALRDFDLETGTPPRTPDYTPDGRIENADPRVAVKFVFDSPRELSEILEEEKLEVPPTVLNRIQADAYVWIIRNLPKCTFDLDPELQELWKAGNPATPPAPQPKTESDDSSESADEDKDKDDDEAEREALTSSGFAGGLQDRWPSFVYFDSFSDILPRTVDVLLLSPETDATSTNPAGGKKPIVPQPVKDYLTLSGIDPKIIAKFSNQDKALNNYLGNRSAQITGDFLNYWKQKVDAEQTVTLQVKQQRNEQAVHQLAFYVHDRIDQYPEQRSKGFVWFLSFYLRLAAAHIRTSGGTRLLLIDEPGTYLHARAQRDVLHLLESRLSQKDPILYSTHSPFLIPADKLHRLRIVLKTADTGTIVVDRLTHPRLRGTEFADTLSPILTAIGLDIRQSLTFARNRNLIVEGISDYYYISAWSRLTGVGLMEALHVFPADGAMSEVMLASLFIGWGLDFAALLDREPIGNAARDKLMRELGVAEGKVIQPEQALGIEDLFSTADFQELLTSLDGQLNINAQREKPTAAIKRQRIDKVLLARRFSENVSANTAVFTEETRNRVTALLLRIMQAVPGPANPNNRPPPPAVTASANRLTR